MPRQFVISKDLQFSIHKKAPLIFSDEDRKLILNSLESKKKNSNFKLMIYLLMFTGLKPSDIMTVTVDRIDLEKLTLRFHMPKIDKWLKRPFSEELKPILSERIEKVKKGKILNYKDEKVMGHVFRDYLEQLQIKDRGYNLRTFRKDFISRGQQAGIPVAGVSKLVGHSNIKTTMDYYTYFSTEFMSDELKKMKGKEVTNAEDKTREKRRRKGIRRVIRKKSNKIKKDDK